MKKEPIRFSASRISCYLDCPKKYYFRYIEKVETVEGTSLPLVFGTNFHAVFEKNDHSLKKDGTFLPADDLKTLFVSLMEDFRGSVVTKTPKDFDDAIQLGIKGISAYMAFLKYSFPEKEKDAFNPTHIEQEVDFMLNLAPIKVYGFIDVVHNSAVIIDRKTSSSKYPTETPFLKQIQPILYALWYRKTFKKKEERFEYHVLVKTKNPYIQVVPVEITEDNIFEMIQLINDIQNKIWAEEFPIKPGWACNYCDYKDICPKGSIELRV